MINKDERKTIIEKIEENYCFMDNAERWEELKKVILSAEGEDNREYIDLQLCKMGDSHLRAHDAVVPSKINLGDILVNDGKLYLFYQNRYCLVSSIDGNKSEDIIGFYEKKFSFLPDNVRHGELTKDYKKCQGFFKGDKHSFTFAGGKKATIHSSDIAEIKASIPKGVELRKMEPVIVVPVDDNTVLIKVITLNQKGISTVFYDKLNAYEVKESSSIILDLRDNQGGLISEAEQILSLLIKNDVTMPYHVVDRNMRYEPEVIKAEQHENVRGKRIFVFINRYTMSSAEYILALGLKEANDEKIVLVGEKTAGVTGQAKVFRISDECILYVTTKRYFDSDERELIRGVSPDIELNIVPNEDISKDNFVEWYRKEAG